MNVLLIYPRLHYDGYGEAQEPLGILYISAALREAGHRVHFIDLTFAESIPDLTDALKTADLVGTGSPTAFYDKAQMVLKSVKAIKPAVPVIIGGPHATVCTESVLQDGFDLVVLGEGERTVLDVAEAVEKGKPLKGLPGTAMLENGEVIYGPPREFIEDLNQLKFPARDLLSYQDYLNSGLIHLGIMATRGCPYNCRFCKPMQDKLFGRRVRIRSAENIFAEMEWAISLTGKTWFLFRDDTLMLCGDEWFSEFGRIRRARGRTSVHWTCQSRVDQINPERLTIMKDAGLVGIAFGVESGSQRVLDFYRKTITPEKTIRAFELCKEFGIGTHAFIMIGAPVETREDLQATVDLVERIRPHSIGISITTPAPGTDLYEYAKEHDLITMQGTTDADYMRNKRPMEMPYLTQQDLVETAKRLQDLVPHAFFGEQIRQRFKSIASDQ